MAKVCELPCNSNISRNAARRDGLWETERHWTLFVNILELLQIVHERAPHWRQQSRLWCTHFIISHTEKTREKTEKNIWRCFHGHIGRHIIYGMAKNSDCNLYKTFDTIFSCFAVVYINNADISKSKRCTTAQVDRNKAFNTYLKKITSKSAYNLSLDSSARLTSRSGSSSLAFKVVFDDFSLPSSEEELEFQRILN